MSIKKISMLAAAAIVTLGAAIATPADAAAAKINLKNCETSNRTFYVFNGGDFLCAVPRHVRVINPGKTNTVKCNDKKDGCKVILGSDVSLGSCMGMTHVKDGQTAVIKPYSKLTAWNGNPSC